MWRKCSVVIASSLLIAFIAGCSAGAIQKNSLCERSSRVNTASENIGNMGKIFSSSNGPTLKSQLLDDLNALTVSQDVAPSSLDADFAYLVRINQTLFDEMSTLYWDSTVAATNSLISQTLSEFSSVTTTRHLARVADFLLKNCGSDVPTNFAPPDSAIDTVATSTSLLAAVNDRINPDPPAASENIALGITIAESLGIKVTNEVARCLGEKAQSSTQMPTIGNSLDQSLIEIFTACGIDISTTTVSG